jgi:hypothetical protein
MNWHSRRSTACVLPKACAASLRCAARLVAMSFGDRLLDRLNLVVLQGFSKAPDKASSVPASKRPRPD